MCGRGHRPHKKNSSLPYDILKRKLSRQYHIRTTTVHTPFIQSPRTGKATTVHHTRFYLLALRKDLVKNPPKKINLSLDESLIHKTSAHVLNSFEEFGLLLE